GGAFGGGHADALVGAAAVELRRFAGLIPQEAQDRFGGAEEDVGGGAGELAELGAGAPAALVVALQHLVGFEGLGEAVGRGPGEPRLVHELSQAGAVGASSEDEHRLVEDAHAADSIRSHELNITSHYSRSPTTGIEDVTYTTWIRGGATAHPRGEGLGRPRSAIRRRTARPALHRPPSAA